MVAPHELHGPVCESTCFDSKYSIGSHSPKHLLESYGYRGRVAQLGEHLLCKHEPRSNPSILYFALLMFSTISGNLLLARCKPRHHNWIGFCDSFGTAGFENRWGEPRRETVFVVRLPITDNCFRGFSWPNCEIVSSVRPSARYSLLGSPVRFSNGSTASMTFLEVGGVTSRERRQDM